MNSLRNPSEKLISAPEGWFVFGCTSLLSGPQWIRTVMLSLTWFLFRLLVVVPTLLSCTKKNPSPFPPRHRFLAGTWSWRCISIKPVRSAVKCARSWTIMASRMKSWRLIPSCGRKSSGPRTGRFPSWWWTKPSWVRWNIRLSTYVTCWSVFHLCVCFKLGLSSCPLSWPATERLVCDH